MKNIPTFDEFINESKIEVNLPNLPDGKVWRATVNFNATELPWEKYADSWFGRFRSFNINTEGVQNFPKGRALVINTKGDFWVSNYYDSNSIMPKGDKHYTIYYSDKKWDLFNDWRKKLIFMALEKGLIKMDNITNDDKISMLFTEISNALSDKKKLFIDDIEVLGWDDIKIDFDKGYLKVTGFNIEGKKEETLIRDVLKADIKII